jgi:branched-chain amino acid aminotransferase
MELALANGLTVEERNISLTELYAADEAFGTGSMGELTPIVEVDGRYIVNRSQSNITTRLIHWFKDVHEKLSTPLEML